MRENKKSVVRFRKRETSTYTISEWQVVRLLRVYRRPEYTFMLRVITRFQRSNDLL